MFSARLRSLRPAQSTATKLVALSIVRQRARTHLAAVGMLIGLTTAGLALAPRAASAASTTYAVSISPNVAQAGSSSTFTVTFTNKASTAEIKQLVINVPSGFTITTVGAPSPSSFTVSRSGSQITLTGLLRPSASVSIPISATAPTATGAYKWVTKASGPTGTFLNSGRDLSVTVAHAAAAVVCPANAPCASPTLSAGASPTALATDAQVTAQSGPQADLLTVVLPDPTAAPLLCQETNGSFGQIVTWHVTSRTSTLVYTVHPTNPNYVYDLSDTCFGSTQPFPGAVQNPANGNEFEGTLPFCTVQTKSGPQTNPPPCVQSIVSTPFDSDNDGDSGALLNGDDIPIVTVTVNAPQGDPKFSG